MEVVENEIRAIRSCTSREHPNIVTILDYGRLSSDYFYIDMELCAINLDGYIYNTSSERSKVQKEADCDVFVSYECSIQLQMQNVYTIMTHISDGVKFLHMEKLVHRDLKPSNVLYSRERNLWKITDFGITSEATSSRAITSHYGRGTEAYLAPEMIHSGRYTTKVDIWALGCILWELIKREKAFKHSWAVLDYDKSTISLELGLDEFPQILRSHLSELVGELLHRSPEQRPQIADLCLIFKYYCSICHQFFVEFVNDIEPIPDYPRWRALAVSCEDERELVSRLAEIYECDGHETMAMATFKEFISRNPDDEEIHHSLEMLYERKADWKIAIAGWRSLLEKHPSSDKLLGQLMKVCEKKGAREKTDEETIIEGLKEMVDRRPNVFELRDELRRALQQSGKMDLAIAIWAELVDKHSGVECLQVQLSRACKLKGDRERTIAVWKELLCMHPESLVLQERLRSELNGKENANDEWNRLKETYPAIGEFSKRSFCIFM